MSRDYYSSEEVQERQMFALERIADVMEERAATPGATGVYEPPRCCGEVCGWAEHAGVWVCQHRTDHCFNDDGVPVDRDGRTVRQQQIHLAREANPSRLLG